MCGVRTRACYAAWCSNPKSQTGTSPLDEVGCGGWRLRGPFERNDGQMPTSPEAGDIEIEADSRLTANERVGRGAR